MVAKVGLPCLFSTSRTASRYSHMVGAMFLNNFDDVIEESHWDDGSCTCFLSVSAVQVKSAISTCTSSFFFNC